MFVLMATAIPLVLIYSYCLCGLEFRPQTTDNRPSLPLPSFATNNGLAEYPPLDPAISDDRVKDISVTTPDQSQRNIISNKFVLTSDLTDGLIPEGPIMFKGEGCLPKNGQSSRKCELGVTRVYANGTPLSIYKTSHRRRKLNNGTNSKGRSPGERNLHEMERSGKHELQWFA